MSIKFWFRIMWEKLIYLCTGKRSMSWEIRERVGIAVINIKGINKLSISSKDK